jgi:DNA polymerase III subunit epsilon
MINICFIDFETTGTDVLNDYPIEIGAVVVDPRLGLIKKFHSLIRPNNRFHIKESAFKIHGISKQKVLAAPTERQVLADMKNQIGADFRLAAWNMSFDVNMFKTLCYRNSFEGYLEKINYRHIDVQTINYIARELRLIPSEVHSMSDLVLHMGEVRSDQHSALEDAILLAKAYRFLISRFKEYVSAASDSTSS